MNSDKCCCKQSAKCGGSSQPVRTLTPDWGVSDFLGMIRVRLGFGRMSYGMEPGLYAMGSPTPESPVLATANYKLTVVQGLLPGLGAMLWLGAGVSFLLMNFTGCSTFTSLSGVKREMKAIPAQIAAGTMGLVLWSTNWWL